MIHSAQPIALLFCSFSCLAAAGLIYAATCREAVGRAAIWLSVSAAMQGWPDLLVAFTASNHDGNVLPVLGALAQTLSLIALVEFSRSQYGAQFRWLPGRWSYPILALAFAAAMWFGAMGKFDLAMRIAFVAEGLLLCGIYFWQSPTTDPSAAKDKLIAVALLAIFLITTGVGYAPLRAIAALAAVAGLWWLHRGSFTAAERGSIRRQGRLPLAFGLLLIAGCLVLPGKNAEAVALDDDGTVAESFEYEAGTAGSLEDLGGMSETLKQLGSCGLAILLPMLFVGVAWGLSRIPAFRQ